MAEMITLRAYLAELDSMVENESPTEAVSHCRYILQYLPQNVATYRILGKALLQKGRNESLPEHYVQASDIFQRVLSVVPDDAVAHVALSEIREQDGALDQAIWHMERAQDRMPGNTLIHNALRRLYARRTGQEDGGSGKLQLSRAAVARQYASSQLFDQAILELRHALQSAPSRVDLQLLLATLLWESHHLLEAGEVAGEILKKLPYCLEANALMARFWLAYGRPSDAQLYIDRVESLDPYAAQRLLAPEGHEPDPNLLERLDYTARAAAALSAETPEWVQDLDDLDSGPPAPARYEAESAGRGPSQLDTAAIFGSVYDADLPGWAQDHEEAAAGAAPDWLAPPEAEPVEALSPAAPVEADWLGEDESESVPEPGAPDEGSAVPDWFVEIAAADQPPEAAAPLYGVAEAEARALFVADADDMPPDAEADDIGSEFLAADWFSPEMDAADAREDDDQRPAPAAIDLPVEQEQAARLALDDVHDASHADRDDHIAGPDRSFEAFPAAQVPGPDAPAEVADGERSESAAAVPPDDPLPDPNDWMALFRQPAPGWEAPPSADAGTEELAAPEPLEWGALFEDDALPDDAAPDTAQLAEMLAGSEGLDAQEPESAAGGVEDWFADLDAASAGFAADADLPGTDQQPGANDTQAEPAEPEDALGGLFAQAEPPLDQDLLEALVQAPGAADGWLDQLESGPRFEDAAAPEDMAAAALSDEDILAIFGEPSEEERTFRATQELSPAPHADDVAAEPETAADWLGETAVLPEEQPPDRLDIAPRAAAHDGAGHDEGLTGAEETAANPPLAEAALGEWAATQDDDLAVADIFQAEDAPRAPIEEAEEAEVEDSPALSGLARAVEQAQQAQTPDWMAGLEIQAGAAPDEAFDALLDEVYDPFEGGDVANVPTYESAGHTGILQPDEEPDWMRAFTGELASEEDGESGAEALDFAHADLVDAGPEDAVAAFDAAALAPDSSPADPPETRVFDTADWDMPGDDLVLGYDSEARSDSEAEIPDWLSAITEAAEPDSTSIDEEEDFSLADPAAQAVPEWLREMDEPASDAVWSELDAAPESETLAPAGDFVDTLAESEYDLFAEPVEDGEIDDSFSFADRLPTWLRRGRSRLDE